MVVYVCSCLNVKIFADAIKLQDVNQTSPLGRNVVEIELGDRGFDFKYGFLLKRETVKSWTVFTCLNCRKKTHCINRELKLILVNKDMECGEEVLSRLTASADFSPAFQIILNNRDYCFATPDPSSQSYSSLQQQLADITHHLNNFVLKQEDLIEERIRQFEEEQRERLAELKAKAHEDKKKMISLLLLQSDPQEQSASVARAQRPRTVLTKAASLYGDSPRPHLSQAVSVPGTQRSEHFVPDIDRDELFTIDGLDEDFGSYHASSEDEDDVPNVMSGRPRTGSRSNPLYSASVPVNIGMGGHWEPMRRGDNLVDSSDSEDEGKPLDPAQIASNMQALAESIPDENRYIFGDRPRPRLNTNNF